MKLTGGFVLTILTFFTLTFSSFSAKAQLAEPVKWSFSAEKINNEEYKLTLKADIADGWYVYSQELPKMGPVPTQIKFDNNQSIVLDGKALEVGEKKEDFDPTFNMKVVKLTGQSQFVQKVKVVGGAASIKGNLMYMTCNGQMCMPPKKVEFNISLNR